MKEKSFNEKFPSLKGLGIWEGTGFAIEDIQAFCLDKQRVREVIDNQVRYNRVCVDCAEVIKKELGI